ncbi:MAG: fibronectin type III domain-containing protein, partial [Solirubrobacterales bacterium]
MHAVHKPTVMCSLLLTISASAQFPPRPSIITAGPYLQYATQTGISILWETSEKATSVVEYGEKTPLKDRIAGKEACEMHEMRIENLKPQSYYFYRVVSKGASGQEFASEVYSFQTAVNEDTPYAFGAISDTQSNPP